MEQNTFRIDSKDQLYKKLIKLPAAYYKLKHDGNKYIIGSHNNTIVDIGSDTNGVNLKWDERSKKIVLYKENSPLKLNGENFSIEQEAIIGKNGNDIINRLKSGEAIKVLFKDIEDSPDFFIKLFVPEPNPITGVLNFINFYDENDPVLNRLTGEKGEFYLTAEDNNIYISDKDGKCVPVYGDDICYQYQYKQDTLVTLSDVSTIMDSLKNRFLLQRGEKLSEDIYEAKIVLNGKTMATLPKIGYYMVNDLLVVRNHVTNEEVVIPRDFHYLKAVKSSSGDYKLTFCNVLGNEFFEYKKYDPEYSKVSDEYKFINLNCAKKEYHLNLSELMSHRPLFFITEGADEPNSNKYSADVFELTRNGKGKKIATLIDEFGYFDQQGMFHHCNYHKGSEYQSYSPAEINKEYKITDADSEFYLTRHDDITLHTIPELCSL